MASILIWGKSRRGRHKETGPWIRFASAATGFLVLLGAAALASGINLMYKTNVPEKWLLGLSTATLGVYVLWLRAALSESSRYRKSRDLERKRRELANEVIADLELHLSELRDAEPDNLGSPQEDSEMPQPHGCESCLSNYRRGIQHALKIAGETRETFNLLQHLRQRHLKLVSPKSGDLN